MARARGEFVRSVGRWRLCVAWCHPGYLAVFRHGRRVFAIGRQCQR